MRTKKLFSMKKAMRTMALGLAAMLVAGSLNVMEVSAIEKDGIVYPGYENGQYTYDRSDIFGAATHVHLFGKYVKTDVHTHGNVMALDADLSEIGMREGKIAYPNEYTEVHYVGNSLIGAGSTINGHMILGKTIGYNAPDATLANGSSTPLGNLVKGTVYKEGDTKAVEVEATLEYLKGLSDEWARKATTDGATYDFSEINTRVINTNQLNSVNDHIFINIPYKDWRGENGQTTQPITIKGLDSNVSHKGIVVINIDLAGCGDTVDLTLNEIIAQSDAGTMSNTEHTSAAFGSCRIVYNLIDSSKGEGNRSYVGNVTFGNTVYGTILAPAASVRVNAVNGNVMADRIVHDGGESHRLDIYPLFTQAGGNGTVVTDKIGAEDIVLRLELEGVTSKTDFDTTTTPVESKTLYNLHLDDNGKPGAVVTTNDDAANKAFSDISAEWVERFVWDDSAQKYVDEGTYEIEIGSEFVTNFLRNPSASQDFWLVKDNNNITPGYDDNNVVFKVTVSADGKVTYSQADLNADGSVSNATAPQRDIMTDVLKKGTTAPTIEDIVLNLDLKGDDESKYVADELSGVKYQLYEDVKLQTEVTGKEGAADWVGDHFEVTIPGTGLTPGETYYLAKEEIAGNADGYKDNKTIYEVNVGTDGKITYRVTDNGTFSGTPEAGPLTDLLIRPNGPAGLDVIFNGPTGTKPGTNDKVSYEIYEDPECTKPVAGSKTEVKPSTSNNTGWNVEFGTDITDKLEQDKTYYIAISGNDSSYKDEEKTVYEVQFDSSTGNAEYNNGGTWTTTIPTDKLIKNEEVQLNVKLEGDTSGNTNSDVTYDIYDATTGDKVTDTPIQATDNDKNGTYEVIVDSTVTTEKLDRDKIYYIEVSENNSGYTDKSKDKYYVKFDKDGNAQYSTDKQVWQDAPLTDLLVKDTVKPSEDPSDKPAEDTNKPSTGGNDDTNKAPSTGGNDSNNGGANGSGSGNAATDGAGANNATDGANANNSAATGSNSMDSAKTGEVQTVYIFAGFAAVIAIAAGVYVFIKRKRA